MFNLYAFLSYVIAVTYTPGPNNIMSMVNASQYGFRKTVNFMLGVATGIFCLSLLSSYFNLLLLNLIPKIQIFMGMVGALYMSYLAIKIMISKPSSSENEKGSINYITGIFLQLANAKLLFFLITVTANFIVPYFNNVVELILFSFFLSAAAFSSVLLWALFGSVFKKFLSNYHRPFSIAMGLLLIYSAISILDIIK